MPTVGLSLPSLLRYCSMPFLTRIVLVEILGTALSRLPLSVSFFPHRKCASFSLTPRIRRNPGFRYLPSLWGLLEPGRGVTPLKRRKRHGKLRFYETNSGSSCSKPCVEPEIQCPPYWWRTDRHQIREEAKFGALKELACGAANSAPASS